MRFTRTFEFIDKTCKITDIRSSMGHPCCSGSGLSSSRWITRKMNQFAPTAEKELKEYIQAGKTMK